MGSIGSKGFREMLDDEFQGLSTPPARKRVLDKEFDPRSPSCGLERTPIQVDKTPDASLIDPRSPSVGIARTPIVTEKNGAPVIDPRSPSCGIDRTPIYTKNQGAVSSADVDIIADLTEELAAIPFADSFSDVDSRTASEPVKIPDAGLEDSLELMVKASPGSDIEDSAQLIKTPDSSSKKSDKKSKTPSKDQTRGKKSKAALFQGHTNIDASPSGNPAKDGSQRSPLRLIGDSQRSPLNRKMKDVNSPRAIVQRKQVNKISIIKGQCSVQASKSPAKYKVFHDDKENNTPEL